MLKVNNLDMLKNEHPRYVKINTLDILKTNTLDIAKNKQPRIKLTRGRKVKVKGYKKAIITLKKGQTIDLTTGI